MKNNKLEIDEVDIEDYIEENKCCPFCHSKKIRRYETTFVTRTRNLTTDKIIAINDKKINGSNALRAIYIGESVYWQYICDSCGYISDTVTP